MADASHESAVGRFGQPFECGIARFAIGTGHPHLDELVVLQRSAGLGDHAFADPTVADENEGFERVGEATQVTPLFVIEFHGADCSRPGAASPVPLDAWQPLKTGFANLMNGLGATRSKRGQRAAGAHRAACGKSRLVRGAGIV